MISKEQERKMSAIRSWMKEYDRIQTQVDLTSFSTVSLIPVSQLYKAMSLADKYHSLLRAYIHLQDYDDSLRRHDDLPDDVRAVIGVKPVLQQLKDHMAVIVEAFPDIPRDPKDIR